MNAYNNVDTVPSVAAIKADIDSHEPALLMRIDQALTQIIADEPDTDLADCIWSAVDIVGECFELTERKKYYVTGFYYLLHNIPGAYELIAGK
jgi:hypothetical protein